jgi:translation initiation factor RLI1
MISVNVPMINLTIEELNAVSDRDIGDLSGGELQRFAIAVVAVQEADMYYEM